MKGDFQMKRLVQVLTVLLLASMLFLVWRDIFAIFSPPIYDGEYGNAAATPVIIEPPIFVGPAAVPGEGLIVNLAGQNITDQQLKELLASGAIPANVTHLDLSGNYITNVAPLAALTNLTELQLWGNNFAEISSLNTLVNLRSFNLGDNWAFNGDFSVLRYFVNLTDLGLSGGTLMFSYDLTPIESLTNLERFRLWGGTAFTDFSIFTNPGNITHLTLNGVNIQDFSPLKYFTNLVSLDLQHSGISDLSTLYLCYLINLTELFVWGNYISDVAPLRYLTNLERLALGGNRIVDISPLWELKNLQQLDLHDNPVCMEQVRELQDVLPWFIIVNY